MHNYRFKYLSTIDTHKWIICIIRADSLQAAITELKATRTITNDSYRLVGACGSSEGVSA